MLAWRAPVIWTKWFHARNRRSRTRCDSVLHTAARRGAIPPWSEQTFRVARRPRNARSRPLYRNANGATARSPITIKPACLCEKNMAECRRENHQQRSKKSAYHQLHYVSATLHAKTKWRAERAESKVLQVTQPISSAFSLMLSRAINRNFNPS